MRPEKTSFYNKNTKIDQSTKRECIDKEASFNLMCKHPQDDRKKCKALYNYGETAHKQCLDNTARCKVSYLSRRRGVFPKQGEYNFSVCLDRMEIDKDDGLKVSINLAELGLMTLALIYSIECYHFGAERI